MPVYTKKWAFKPIPSLHLKINFRTISCLHQKIICETTLEFTLKENKFKKNNFKFTVENSFQKFQIYTEKQVFKTISNLHKKISF